jgi:hypothetical protein
MNFQPDEGPSEKENLLMRLAAASEPAVSG